MENGPAPGPERDAWVAKNAVKKDRESTFVAFLLVGGVCFGVFLLAMFTAPQPGCYYNDGVRDTMKNAIDAGVAEIREYEVEHALGRKSKRQEYRWKKCPE